LIKGLKTDQIHLLLSGLENVDFGKKDLEKCLKPQSAIMKDTTSKEGKVDWSKCVSYNKNMG